MVALWSGLFVGGGNICFFSKTNNNNGKKNEKSLSICLSLPPSLPLPFSLSLSITHTRTHSYTPTHSHTHTHSRTHKHTYTSIFVSAIAAKSKLYIFLMGNYFCNNFFLKEKKIKFFEMEDYVLSWVPLHRRRIWKISTIFLNSFWLEDVHRFQVQLFLSKKKKYFIFSYQLEVTQSFQKLTPHALEW